MKYEDLVDNIKASYTTETFSTVLDTEVLWIHETASLYIRGTDSILDWVFNLLMFPEQTSGIHWGFYIRARYLHNELVKRKFTPKSIVGHSAGAAIAQPLGWWYNCETYSVATPRTVLKPWASFTKWADEKLYIINHKDDPVSKQPFFMKHPTKFLELEKDEFDIFTNHLIGIED